MNWRAFLKREKINLLKQFKSNESLIYELLAPENRYLGQRYFDFLAPKLCHVVNADYIMIGQLDPSTGMVRSLILTNGNKQLPGCNYNIEETPCRNVIGKKSCSITKEAYKQFPHNSFIANKKIESYIGIPLFNSGYEANGILVALFNRSITQQAHAIESLLFLYTPRISAEIEHIAVKHQLKVRNEDLEGIHFQLQQKNEQLDNTVKALNQANIKAEENNQLKSAFLANLSHEIRTPMNAILGFSELLKANNLSNEEKVEYVDIINQNGSHLLKVMDNLIDISKLQTRLLQDGPVKFKLNALLEQMLQHYMKEIRLLHKPINIYLEKGAEEHLDTFITDKEGLIKVLNHLLDNAVKFTSKGWIKFGYTLQKSYLQFFVSDTGIGIPEGQENNIFDLFRQLDSQNSREFGGTGLGLSISKKYIDALGGEIWLENDKDKGSCFYFTLPFKTIKAVTEKAHSTNSN
ncbi:MAG: hypothetical protein JEZ14_10175 [Marinilabiliaceae bacterium]|nr:hypothetical protein [Marinilabiliaceae bacterium]